MSCGCGSNDGYGYDGGVVYNDYCNADTPYPSVSHESVPSLIDNLVYALYGTINKEVLGGKVVWNIPCDPSNIPATINGIPRGNGEGLLCYILRALNLTNASNGFVTINGVQTLTNKTLIAPVINTATINNLTATGTLALPIGSITTAMIANGTIVPADLSTGGPSWDASGNLTATRLLAYGQGGNPRNMAIGDSSLNANTSGTNNTAVGYLALYSNTTGSFNVAFGPNTLQTNSTGNNNVGVGQNALTNNTSGSQNLAFGVYSLVNNTTGNNNVGNGQGSLQSNTTGSNNVAIGQAALQNNSTGSYNVGIGANVSSSTTVVSNEVNIYNGAATARFQGAASSWTFVSDERDKSNIESLEIGLDFINQLQPRKFKWTLRDSDVDQGKEAAGFIAQEVFAVSQEANADYLGLVDTNNPDQFTFAATNLIPVLVNAIKELKAEIELLKAK
jgi:hypothetical protein